MFLDFDPCEEGKAQCEDNSTCVVEGESFRCVCNPGFQFIHTDQQQTCADINECDLNIADCDFNAECINEAGSFSCVCKPGFVGNGQKCENALSCLGVVCPENSECVLDSVASCKCLPGFTGDGLRCTAVQSLSCHLANNCSPFAYCSINPETSLYACNCLPNFEGDGYNCNEKPEEPEEPEETTISKQTIETTTELTTDIPEDHEIERCLLTACWCPTGYKKLQGTKYCIPGEPETTTTTEEPKPEGNERNYTIK